ncbi:heme lyase CcmF/NrfE family subunit [Xinfangfangia sp. D13-10-4-6]|uniref:heme lyase CcmF/NrfE family subunit n=1 Tax=Pseudogemmobacter hezensis TaxID=2737662 RepID=UPI001554BDC8|nr:heme lyase CcmF/NrfE family subunit [Pseudogemmobacter hezensis]NPD15902.1 heme lyase CcmF/NrfE family subunit [Pseudogemmobacter hezensis]
MLIELGHFALILALMVALVQTILPLWGAWRGRPVLMAVAEPAAVVQFALIAFAFGVLTWAFVTSDFSVALVVSNSHTLKPMLYKISGTWGNHEGSLLLWTLILALFGASAAWFGGALPARLRARVIAVQGSVGVAFLAFMLFTSNPFLRMEMPPMDGRDLNPLLQDPGLAFHPPFLYLGYVGLSMSFSFAIAALIGGRVDAAWARWVRPWTLAAWVFLTIGIALGSWWAYYELGWGGFWFWDPVENASFMPWLLAAALLHSAIVVEKRESLKSWTILLAILAFGFSLIGTFIVRSGVITSVHSFASDPERGIFILMILGFFTGGGLTLFAARAGAMQARGVFGLVSRESALVANNILLAVGAFVVFIGTMWPLFAELLLGRVMSVGEPFFNAAFTPFFVALALILPLGAMLAWKRGDPGRVLGLLAPAALAALAVGLLSVAITQGQGMIALLVLVGAGLGLALLWARVPQLIRRRVPLIVLGMAVLALIWAVQTGRSALGPIGVMLGAWVVFGSLADLWSRSGREGTPLAGRLGRLRHLPRAEWGKAIAHAGMGVVVFSVSAMLAWKVEVIAVVAPGDSFALGPYSVQLADVRAERGPNYISTMAEMVVRRGGAQVVTLYPEKRSYPVQGMPTTEAGIDYGWLRDIYLVIGDPQENGGWAVRAYIEPFANWLWAGCALMALGGLFSLSDRRYRVAPAGAKSARPRGKEVPAE